MTDIKGKAKKELETMKEGGRKLGRIKKRLQDEVSVGKTAEDIEDLAQKLIKEAGGKPSFMMVPNYNWATCVNVNEGVVHGIPKKGVVFKKGDVVSVDVGLYYNGFHTDTSFTVGLNPTKEVEKFLEVGKKALKNAIKKARPGGRIYDISKEMQDGLEKAGYEPIRALVGHGIGKNLHEPPQIPCFVSGKREKTAEIPENATFAIEIMYTMGDSGVGLDQDGWTISTQDGKISAISEETVAATAGGPLVLTEAN